MNLLTPRYKALMTLDSPTASSTLIARFQAALAGRPKLTASPAGLRPAAVLLLLYLRDGEEHILLTKRTSRVDDHKGEIAFPGGSFHPGEDNSLRDTALRESAEEVGLITAHAELLGELDDQTTSTGYHISPFVAALPRPQHFVPQLSEVEAVLETPLRALLDPVAFGDAPRSYGGKPVRGFYYLYGEHVIWGATARMLQQLFSLLTPPAM